MCAMVAPGSQVDGRLLEGPAPKAGAPRKGAAEEALCLPRFLEVFGGAGGLSAAVEFFGSKKAEVLSGKGTRLASVDVSSDEDFSALLSAGAHWVHGAPPCRTFSAARRSDNVARARKLRSAARPAGFGSEQAEAASKLAKRMLELAKAQLTSNGYFSIENPLSSLLWALKPYRA